MKKYCLYLAVFLALGIGALAQMPRIISYQGILTDASGNFISDGNHTLSLKLYENAGGGAAVFSETHNVPVVKGIFNAIIGSITPLPSNLSFDRAYFLGVSVDGGAEMSPRTALTTVPYAMHAAVADKAMSLDASVTGVVTNINGLSGALTLQGSGGTTINQNGNTIVIGSSGGGSGSGIQGVQNGDGTMNISNGNGPVATINIATGGIGTTQLANTAVTSDKLADDAVASKHIQTSAITTAKLADGSVIAGKLADGAVITGKLADASITTSKINDAAITTVKIGDGVVVGSKIANAAIATQHIQNGAVTSAQIGSAAATNGQVLTANGSGGTSWATVGGLTLPYSGTSAAAEVFKITSTSGKAGIFENTAAANANDALIGSTNGSGNAVHGISTIATGSTTGVLGEAASTSHGTGASSGVSGVVGKVTSTTPGGYSAGVRGVNNGTSGTGIGVIGYQAGSGWGVYGETPSGFGVYGLTTNNSAASVGVRGETFSTNGIAVEAKYSGTGVGTALELDNGAIRVAGVNKCAFVHTATVANKLSANGTDVDNALCNGDPNAILIVTQKLNPSGIVYNNSPIGVYYNSVRNKWEIFNQNNVAIPTNAQFNVLVIKQ